MTDEKKGTLGDKLLSASVGYCVFRTGIEITMNGHDIGEKLGNDLQEYVGSVGAAVIEFGLPTISTVVYLALTVLATHTMYTSSKRWRYERQEREKKGDGLTAQRYEGF